MHLLSIVIIATAGFVLALDPPGCQDTAPSQQRLSTVQTAQLTLPGQPFGIVYATKQQDTAFVVLSGVSGGGSLGVLDTSTFPPALRHQLAIPRRDTGGAAALGLALTHDGQRLIAAAGVGGVIFDTDKAAAGSADAIVGTLNGITPKQSPSASAIQVTVSPDDRYAFISQEIGPRGAVRGNVDVFRVQNGTGMPVGFLTLAYAVVGTAISPDGKTLYVTSEQTAPDAKDGLLHTVDLATLEQSPETALRSSASAGCSPVRTLVSSDGKTVWVTARGSNHLLAFDASKLGSEPTNALVASVQVGTAPVGLAFARNETIILTADSNRFNSAGSTTGLTVVGVDAALAGKPAVLGSIPTGQFPRELATSPDGKTILVSDFMSMQVQAVDVTTLPSVAKDDQKSMASPSLGLPAPVWCMILILGWMLR